MTPQTHNYMESLVPFEKIENKIFFLRGHKVMLDLHLAELYQVETKMLKRAVRRNVDRFPADFMFELTYEEYRALDSYFGSKNRGGRRHVPYAFTEQGIAMLSTVLNSQRAIHVNIEIIRTFVKLRKLMSTHKDLVRKINAMEKKYDTQFRVVFDAIRQLMEPPLKKQKFIGFGR